jgi:hypothetical protein
MRFFIGRAILAAVAASISLFCQAQSGPTEVTEQFGPETANRVYAGADGLTHVDEVDLKMAGIAGAPPTVEASPAFAATKSYVMRLAPGFSVGWHTEDVRRYVIPIRGVAELEVGSGQKVTLVTGEIYLFADLTGKGHTFRVLGPDAWVALYVDLGR